LQNPEKFDEVYSLLADEESKLIFDWFIKYRVTYAFLDELAGEIFLAKITKTELLKEKSSLERNIRNGLITLKNFSFKSEVLETVQAWNLEQYNLREKCEVAKGDYVIDGGAFKGETSFWFLSKGAGKVYAFEPDPYNFSILTENVKRNKASDKIIPVQKALSNRIGTFSFCATGRGGSASREEGNITVEGVTIDSFVEKEGLERIDFIKLDVEGAELEVLEGAIETIKKFKPKMAISVYHKPEDIITIPNLLQKYYQMPEFYLSHNNYGLDETILFVKLRNIGEEL
jgi:FkbM family methyltransferase